MNTMLGMLKLAAVALCFAAGVGATQFAHAGGFGMGYNGWHHHSNYNVSIGLGGGYYGGGYYGPRYSYAPSYYAPRPYYYGYAPCYAPYYYNGYACVPQYYASPGYYNNNGYYGQGVSIGYSNYGYGGYNGYYGGRRGGDGDRDDRRPGGWDRGHYYDHGGNQPPHR
ncbi:MAG TPA: hypothetical protein VGT79_02070 [Xanthomonadaceae bacterium]|nr:hypothetical protein [Xanthomonadaceae bacterium]